MKELLIGRQREQKSLVGYIDSGRSEFIAIYGRRRVGKTYLVRHTIADRVCFSVTGMENVGMEEQYWRSASIKTSTSGRTASISIPAPPLSSFRLLLSHALRLW